MCSMPDGKYTTLGSRLYAPHIRDKEDVGQRGKVSCPSSLTLVRG